MTCLSMHRSNEVKADIDAVVNVLSETVSADATALTQQKWTLRGDMVLHEETGTIHFEGFGTMFGVSSPEHGPDASKEYLKNIAPYIKEQLIIRSVDFNGVQHIPKVYQYVVENGTVELERLTEEHSV